MLSRKEKEIVKKAKLEILKGRSWIAQNMLLGIARSSNIKRIKGIMEEIGLGDCDVCFI